MLDLMTVKKKNLWERGFSALGAESSQHPAV